VRRSLESRLCS